MAQHQHYRNIVKIIRVQPGVNILVEDSHNILLELNTPDGELIGRGGALTNIDRVIEALEAARIWVRVEEEQ